MKARIDKKKEVKKGTVSFINADNNTLSVHIAPKIPDLTILDFRGYQKSQSKSQPVKNKKPQEPLFNDKQYLPLAQVGLSEMCFNKMLLDNPLNVRTKEYEDFKNMFYAIYFNQIDIANNILKKYPEKNDWKHLYRILSDGNSSRTLNLNISLLICLEWSKNKQVFKFDKEFLDELTATESVIFKKDMLDYLPYKNFYVDLEDIETTSKLAGMKVDGIFINVVKNSNKYHIQVTFANRIGHTYCDIIVENTDREIKSKNIAFNKNVLKKLLGITINQSDDEFQINHEYWDNMILQMLTYLCSSKPDIQESEETKRTYKKPDINVKPKNKFSEIQKWEVGVRFGTSIKQWKKEKKYEETENNNADNTGTELRQHYKPHYRRGHWHSYWCNEIVDGKKIRRLVPKWLAPIFVNQNLCDNVDVVIHKP